MIGAVCKALLLRTLARHPQGPASSNLGVLVHT